MLSERKQKNAETRRRMLSQIRRELAASAAFDAVHREHHAQQQAAPENGKAAVVSDADLQNVGLIERFRTNLISIGGNCTIVQDLEEAAQTIQTIIEKTKACGIAVSDSPLIGKICSLVETKAVLTGNVSAAELFEFDLGITGAQWAIAETGTLVLESELERHRLSSLVPPIHVCVVEAECFRRTLGEILELLNTGENLSRTVTFVTGPSRTSDIELTLAIGVHGPAELHVIVIAGENNG